MAEFDDQGGSMQNAAGTTEGGAAAASGLPLPTFMWKPREDPFTGEMKPDDKTMGMLCHLLGIFLGILGPLIVWLTKRDSSPYVNVHGREAINFHLSFIIYIVALGLISAVLAMIPFIGCVVILFPVLIGLMLLIAVVLLIVGAVKANQGKVFRYPVTIRMIR